MTKTEAEANQPARPTQRIGGLISQRDAAELKLAEAERELFLMRRVAEGNEAEIARLTRERDEWKATAVSGKLDRLEAENAALREVVEAARFKHNAIIHDDPKFVGRWIAVPEEDFDKLRTALAALEEK